MNIHATRIQEALKEIQLRGGFARLEPAAILVETRRLLESEAKRDAYPHVVLYADWCVHTELDRGGAARVLLQVTDSLNRVVNNPAAASNDAVCKTVRDALDIQRLQNELVSLYAQYSIETWHLTDLNHFRQFMGAVLDTIAEHPLKFPANAATAKGAIGKAYADAMQAAGGSIKLLVVQCSVTNDLSLERLAFFEVPAATYTWQIVTADGVAWAGLL